MRRGKPGTRCAHRPRDAMAVRLPDGETFAILCNGKDGCPQVHQSAVSADYINSSPIWSRFFNVRAESTENAMLDLESKSAAEAISSAEINHFLRGKEYGGQ